jgi:hypothetical protein
LTDAVHRGSCGARGVYYPKKYWWTPWFR